MIHQGRRRRGVGVAAAAAVAAVVAAAACAGPEPAAPSEPRLPEPAAPVKPEPAAPDTPGAPSDSPDAAPTAAAAASSPSSSCEPLPFAAQAPIAEASGAVWIPAAGDSPAHLLVVADSGNSGALVALDADSGKVLAQGRLPLGKGAASDDLEGLSWSDGTLYAITSSGWMREWRPEGGLADFELRAGPYPLATPGSPLVCLNGLFVNCGPNYEGLCLRPQAPAAGECAGVAVAKSEGRVYCLVRDHAGRLAVDAERWLQVTATRGGPTGCDYAPDADELWVGSNSFDAARVYRITGASDLPHAHVEPVAEIGPGFPEALAVGAGGVIYRFSDTGGAPSLMSKHRCRAGGSE